MWGLASSSALAVSLQPGQIRCYLPIFHIGFQLCPRCHFSSKKSILVLSNQMAFRVELMKERRKIMKQPERVAVLRYLRAPQCYLA
ncbi:hypothetical protein TorRG33x02_329900, partial [Trema orientale]